MKTEQILIKFSKEEMEELNTAYKEEIISNSGLISRSEFIRRLISQGIESKGSK